MEQNTNAERIINEINANIDKTVCDISVTLDKPNEQILGEQLYKHFNLHLLKKKRKNSNSYMLPILTIQGIEVYVEIDTTFATKYIRSLSNLLDDSDSDDADGEKITTIRLHIRSHIWVDYSATKNINRTLSYYNQKLAEGAYSPELYITAATVLLSVLPKLRFNKILSRFTTNEEDYFKCTSQYVRHDLICETLYDAFNQNQSSMIVDMDSGIIVDMDICCICRDKTRISIAHCSHYICIPCLDKMTKSMHRNKQMTINNCPLCRVEFFPTEIYNGLYDEFVPL